MRVVIGNISHLVHNLVMAAFSSGEGPVKHKNGNKRDNRFINLYRGDTPNHTPAGIRCSKNHELIGENVITWGSNRICKACLNGEPAVRQLPEIL